MSPPYVVVLREFVFAVGDAEQSAGKNINASMIRLTQCEPTVCRMNADNDHDESRCDENGEGYCDDEHLGHFPSWFGVLTLANVSRQEVRTHYTVRCSDEILGIRS